MLIPNNRNFSFENVTFSRGKQKNYFLLDSSWSLIQKNFSFACPWKKLHFRTKNCDFFEKVFLKIGLFRMVKNFFKLDKSRHGVSHEHLESEAKNFLL